MVNLNETMIMPMNGIALVLLIAFMILGYKKGFARSVLSLIGSAASSYIAWILSDPLSKHVALYHAEINSLASVILEAGSYLVNRMIWFLICFVILRIAVFVLDHVLKGIHEIPGVHLIGGLLGAAFGAVEALIWLLLLCVLLETPLFTNGSLVVDDSVLGLIKDKTAEVFTDFASFSQGTDLFTTMKDNVQEISQEQLNSFETWLIENDLETGEE